ncbi:MAG: hypothetical protein HY680_09080 [Chloroflexi bacterium]|nr:hypothetical protein [Chloroflexota bacterium]
MPIERAPKMHNPSNSRAVAHNAAFAQGHSSMCRLAVSPTPVMRTGTMIIPSTRIPFTAIKELFAGRGSV